MSQLSSVLVLRFGAMGDVLHALPAVASLKLSFPKALVAWLVRPKWLPLLEGNPHIDELIPFRREEGLAALLASVKQARRRRPDLAFDFQGLLQSAITGRLTRPRRFWGFDASTAREPMAALFYTHRLKPLGGHHIQRNLQLIQTAGATVITNESWIPQGRAEGTLPDGPFVLAAPFAGWGSKQWPLERYAELDILLRAARVPLVLNVASHQSSGLEQFQLHTSSLPGLIDATRRAAAVVGVDSGPLHLAAALRKPGVAIFGPTDPVANGPFGGSMRVIRKSGHKTSYKREDEIHPSMTAVSAREVFDELMLQLRVETSLGGRSL